MFARSLYRYALCSLALYCYVASLLSPLTLFAAHNRYALILLTRCARYVAPLAHIRCAHIIAALLMNVFARSHYRACFAALMVTQVFAPLYLLLAPLDTRYLAALNARVPCPVSLRSPGQD
jgi:hypothetical protein